MEIKKEAIAGTLESSDILITIRPSEAESIEIDLESDVKVQFGDQIEDLILSILNKHGIEKGVELRVVDKGAIDYVIKARTETAIYRAAESDDFKWEVGARNE